MIFEEGERFEFGEGGGTIGDGQCGEEGGYRFWREREGEGELCEDYHRDLKRGGGGMTARNLTNLASTPFCQTVLLPRRFHGLPVSPTLLVVSVTLPVRLFV